VSGRNTLETAIVAGSPGMAGGWYLAE